MKKLIFLSLCCLAFILLNAQNDSAQLRDGNTVSNYRIGLILPFQTESTSNGIEDFFSAPDFYTASRTNLNNYATEALDFYQGLLQSLNEDTDSIYIDLHVYDCWNSDSVTEELLRNPNLKKADVIIGPSATSNAKIIADFCKENHILNVQPFTPSKSLTSNNPYHLKLAATIDAHVDNLFLSILDSFTNANIILYSPDNEIGQSTAQRFDSLFKDYNRTSAVKFSVTSITVKDLNSKKDKKEIADFLMSNKTNILIVTSFEGSFVNGTLGSLLDKTKNYNIITYGMPTWLNSEILRLDYLNSFNCRLSDGFYPDTTKEETIHFINNYISAYYKEPSEMSFLGYDVMNFLFTVLHLYGKDFLDKIITQRFTGTAHKFDIMKEMSDSTHINYYENRHVNVYEVEEYKLKKIY